MRRLTFAVIGLVMSSSVQAFPSNAWRMDIEDLDHFRVNCSIKEQQLAWLTSQYPTRWEVFKNDVFGAGIVQAVWMHWQGTYSQYEAVRSRRQQAVVKWLMFDLVRQCDWSTIKTPQCLQVTDDTQFGAATSQKCWDGRHHSPVLDKWEVD